MDSPLIVIILYVTLGVGWGSWNIVFKYHK
jgi:hypothetical protein